MSSWAVLGPPPKWHTVFVCHGKALAWQQGPLLLEWKWLRIDGDDGNTDDNGMHTINMVKIMLNNDDDDEDHDAAIGAAANIRDVLLILMVMAVMLMLRQTMMARGAW